MTLTDQITDCVHAAFTGLWVQTSEPDEAERDLLRHARDQGWKVAVWDVPAGLRLADASAAPTHDSAAGDPLAPLHALPPLAERATPPLLLPPQFHPLFTN